MGTKFHQITVTGPVLLVSTGQVQLTAAQAVRRRGMITPVRVEKSGVGIYLVRKPLQFKRGEEVGIDVDMLDKSALGQITPTDALLDPQLGEGKAGGKSKAAGKSAGKGKPKVIATDDDQVQPDTAADAPGGIDPMAE